MKLCFVLICLFFGFFTACSKKDFVLQKDKAPFLPVTADSLVYATQEILEVYEKSSLAEYLLGPGDVIEILAINQEDISKEYLISPDGTITIPLAGELRTEGMTRKLAELTITKLLSKYYDPLSLTVSIKNYENNRVFVLGSVANSGIISFKGKGTLLEALSRAGGIITTEKSLNLSRCAIFRGKEQVLWIDLYELLQNGNLMLNVKLANNDVIYVPEPEEANIYVMGEVSRPGTFKIIKSVSLLDAISQAGGITENAVNEIKIIRDRSRGGGTVEVNFNKILKGDLSQNYILQNNDIVYVPRSGIATTNYYLRMLNPFAQTLLVGTAAYTATKDLLNNK